MTLASDALAIARSGIRAVDPGKAVRRNLRRIRGGIRVGGSRLVLAPGGTLHLVAVGKAASAMADAAARVLGGETSGLVVTPRGYPAPHVSLEVIFGEHPVPGPGSFAAGNRLLAFVRSLAPTDSVLFLISGGGSAVAEVPAGSLTGSDLRRTTELLLASGAPIGAMNAIRRHISALKGGQLAAALPGASYATLAISDVVGDPPEDIASGPTVGDPSRFRDALDAARRYHLEGRLPARVRHRLEEGAEGRVPETPKPTDRRLARSPFVLVASNRIALEASVAAARRRGYAAQLLSTTVVGETRPVARAFAARLLRGQRRGGPGRLALLSGGETTVTLGRRPGRGGRNQEFALACAEPLAGSNAVVLSLGTDGVDGPTDAAGGWVDGRTMDRALRRGVDVAEALRRHAAYEALVALGGLVRTGPTGTNVMDVHVGLAGVFRRPGTVGSSRRGAARSSRRRRS
jgi:glycerate 2-kinase